MFNNTPPSSTTANDQRPPQSTRQDRDTDCTSTELAHRLHWEGLVEAGLIGASVAASPEVAAIRDANDVLFRAFRRGGDIW